MKPYRKRVRLPNGAWSGFLDRVAKRDRVRIDDPTIKQYPRVRVRLSSERVRLNKQFTQEEFKVALEKAGIESERKLQLWRDAHPLRRTR